LKSSITILLDSTSGTLRPRLARKSIKRREELFVDEAYRLTPIQSGRDFGPEAVDEIMKDLSEGDPVVMLAGYPDDMDRFLESNAGLQR